MSKLHESRNFMLSSEHPRGRKTGKPMFVITWTTVRGLNTADFEEVRKEFGAFDNSAMRLKFRNLAQARRKYMMLTMRWA